MSATNHSNRGARAGSPVMSKEKLHVYINAEMTIRLACEAERRGMSMSGIVRELLNQAAPSWPQVDIDSLLVGQSDVIPGQMEINLDC